MEHRRAIDGRHVWYTCNLRRLVAAAAAANPAPMDASDMSFDEYADDLLDVFTHHRMKAEKRSGSIRLRRALQGRPKLGSKNSYS